MLDLTIIGAGPAGMTAALYALRSGLKVGMIEQGAPGGQLLKTEKIDNYPGFADGVLGMDLATNMFMQISNFDSFKLINDTAKKITRSSNSFIVDISSGTVESRTVIIATGGYPRTLDIPGEKEYSGKGVSYCAICDGFFFKDKIVAVIGGGNTALEDAMYLSSIAKEVYLIHRRNNFRGSKILVDKIKSISNVHLVLEKVPVEIKGDTKVSEIVVKDVKTESITSLFVNGVFLAIGQIMNSDFVKDSLATDDSGHIVVDEKMESITPGLFACGDVITKDLRQVSTAVGDGAIAGQMAYEYLSKL
ncbi:MAG: thioredoxin-disulfide reductase [Firmicutes bacterium]|nr:thioredoxin-disulfide reductase [Bacillota bacterium]